VIIAAKAQDAPIDRSIVDKIIPIGNEYQNSITLLNNRFRIDDDIEKVTLVFFREFGAQPIVLVRPDGSKLYLDNDAVDDSYRWFETDTYDMIELTEPMPGPWQALGNILEGSKVMVIADLTLNAEPIPKVVFSGETIKQTAVLLNANEEINFREFRDIVVLSIDFTSTNIPDLENFGLGTKTVARFKDNGMGFDESAGDGIFTGEFNLEIANGEWQPIFNIRTPLFSRELMTDKVMVLATPMTISHVEDLTEEGFHRIFVETDNEYIVPSSVLLEAALRGPEGEVERVSITEMGDYQRELKVINSGYGIYSVDMTVFAQTLSGRDIVLKVPQYSFRTEPPVIEEVVVELTPEEILVQQKAAEEAARLAELAAKEQAQKELIIMVLAINGALLFIGVIVILLIFDRRRRPDNHLLKKMGGLLGKISFKKKTSAVDSPTGNA
jgi:uncharacterized protein (TIGR03503 family)